MADDVNPALRAEIDAALDVIGPQIDGLRDLTRIEAPEGFIVLMTDQYNAHVGRKTLLRGVINALDGVNAAMAALEADGYPNAGPVIVSDAVLFQEIEEQKAQIEAALALFREQAAATQLAVNLGAPSDKPNSSKRK